MDSARIRAMHVPFSPSSPDKHEELGAERTLSVSGLNRLAREALERRFPLLWVCGEISNLTRAPSGHLYFTLKDDKAQVRCTMWRNRAQLLPFRPENGMQVEARALPTLYEARGDFQLGVEALRAAGQGNLFEAFLRLKEKLSQEGLFEPAAKRSLPPYPRRIGVVTSPAAAAWQDVLAALRRRAPHLEVVLFPAAVQGEGAGEGLANALQQASARAGLDGLDLVLLVRGGGSIEDLWAFNHEGLARAIRKCPVPVVSGVGHETDFTIADFAADVRAATPTGAAELASAGYHAARERLEALARGLSNAALRQIRALEQRLDRAAARLVHPRDRLRLAGEHQARLAVRLREAAARQLERRSAAQQLLAARLLAQRPDIDRQRERCERLAQRLARAGEMFFERRTERLGALASHLQHLAPDAVLARGYSITRGKDGGILRDVGQTALGDGISVQLANGRLHAIVDSTKA